MDNTTIFWNFSESEAMCLILAMCF